MLNPKNFCLSVTDLMLSRSATEQFAFAYIILISAIFGIIGNILSLMVLLSPVMRSRSQLLSYLAIVDVLFLCSVLPHSIAHYWIFFRHYTFRLIYMKIKMYLIGFSNWTSAAAIWLILLICIERLIGIRYPFFVKKYWKIGSNRSRRILVIFVFVMTFLLTFYTNFSRFPIFKLFCNDTQLHFMHITSTLDRFGNQTNPYPKWLQHLIWPNTIVHALIGVLIPTFIIIVANSLLLRTLKSRGRFLSSFHTGRNPGANFVISQVKLEQNITYTACAIVTCFTITQAPSAVILSTLSHVSFGNPTWHFHLILFADCMVVIGKSLNFVLFCLTSYTFRQRLYVITRLRRITSDSIHFTAMTTYYTSVPANVRSRTMIDSYGSTRSHIVEAIAKIRPARSYSSLLSPSKRELCRLLHIRRAYSADNEESKPKKKFSKWERLTESQELLQIKIP